jgi:DNA-damage-inducible protein J
MKAGLLCSLVVTTIGTPPTASKETTMSTTTSTYVRARIDSDTKARATDALAAMGLSVSDAIRLLMLRIADEHRLPFEIKVPNATTRQAIAELETGDGAKFDSLAALMADLHADD